MSQTTAPVIEPKGRTGAWIPTINGNRWFITDPHPADVDIYDIAHGLSMICRFGGQCRDFYSVAQHSVLIANELCRREAPPEIALWGLLHDAPEAYLGDMVRPLKQSMQSYKILEHVTEGCILVGLNVNPPTHGTRHMVKQLDDVLLMTERRDLVTDCGYEWTLKAEPLNSRIVPWSPRVACESFLAVYHQLRALIAATTAGEEEKDSI
jgi:hypothetical protein